MIEIKKEFDKPQVSWTGRFLYYFLPYKKKVVVKNIELVFQRTLNHKEKKRMAMAYYSHFVRSFKEIILFPFMQKRLQEQFEMHGVEHLITAIEKQKGVLLLCTHLGNCEIGPLISFPKLKIFNSEIHCIRKALKIKWLEKILFQRYQKGGVKIIPNKGAMHRVRKALEANGIIFFVMDQQGRKNVRTKVMVDFFGHKTGSYRSLATLVRRTGAAVIPVAFYRLGKIKHIAEFYPEVEWQEYSDKNEAINHNTQIYNEVLEKIIMRRPEQWIWPYKRWNYKNLKNSHGT
ncbi:lysophospholipid acyltransferase family protein [Legionella sp. 29fVS95]|uniref:lysophospholipid acyltransferase family protein n=1 Tax=Legionella sp. 29fVS95 TaxID=3402813 RepID=UPI003AF72E21